MVPGTLKQGSQLDINVSHSQRKPKGYGTRHTLALLGFWAFAISYAMRFNLSLAIVAMVNSTAAVKTVNLSDIGIVNETFIKVIIEEDCRELFIEDEPENQTAKIVQEGEFNWNEAEQGIVLGSFFWGYCLTQLPGGILAQKFGGKWTLGLGLFITAIFTLLIPIAARMHRDLLIACRFIQGLGEGVTPPAMHVILSKWAPPNERSQMSSVIYAGAQLGTAATMVVGGYLIDFEVMGGWPSVFYIIGAISVLWFIIWVFFMFESPADHPRISQKELSYIQKSLGQQYERRQKIATPWKSFATSMPVWAILVANTCHAWGLYTLLTGLPTYMKTAMHFDIKQNSWMSAFPYLIMWVMSIILTQVADCLISWNILRVVSVRKLCQSLAHLSSAAALIGASYSGCNRLVAVSLLTTAVAVNGAIYGGFIINHIDIAPNFAGVLFGISNTLASVCGFVSPALTGYLINNNPSLGQWQKVFFVTAAIYIVGVVFYVIFASGSEQKWNKGSKRFQEKDSVRMREFRK